MKDIIKRYINQLKGSPFLRRTTITYIVIGCTLLLLFCIIIVNGILSISAEQTNKTMQQMLAQACNTGDLIFRDVHSLITKNIESSSVLAEALYEEPLENTTELNSEISLLVASSSLIDSIYIVNLRHDIVYSSNAPSCSVDDFFDQDIMNIVRETERGTTLYYPRIFDDPAIGIVTTPRNYISCIYNKTAAGAIVVNLNQDTFQSMVNLTGNDDESQITAVINASGSVLSHSQPRNFALDVSDEEYFSEVLQHNDSSGSFKHFGTYVNYARSSYLGFYYVEITDSTMLLGNFYWLLALIIIFTALLMLLYAAASIYITSTTFKPIRTIKDKLEGISKSPSGDITANELTEIENIVENIRHEQSIYKRIQYDFLSTKRNELIHKLLFGTFTYSQDDLDEYNIVFDKQFFGVVMARIDRLKEIDPANIPIIKYGIMNIGDEVLAKVGRVYSIESNEFDIAWVINYDDYHPLMPAVEQVQKFVESIYKITASFGCNFGADSAEDLSDLYHNAQYSLSYRLSKGYNSIILYNSIKDSAQNICEYPDTLERDIISDMTTQNRESMRKNIHKFMDTISTASYSTVIMHANRLLSAVDQIAVKITSAEDAVTVNNIETMTRMETISEIESFVAARCESVSIKFSEIKSDSKKDMIANTIIDYIDEHFRDSNLSIDMIANEVNRSANYTRSIFKQSQGISISDYISNKRFDEVCRILLETNMTAQEIGKQVGLNSGSYFYTAFKKHTGYTPDQYRKIHQHTQQSNATNESKNTDEKNDDDKNDEN